MPIALLWSRAAPEPVARLATLGAAGLPDLVPICFVITGDLLFTAIDHKPKASPRPQRLANIEREPRVRILIDHYEEDWSRLWWIRLEGQAQEVPPDPDVLALLQAKYTQYRAHPPAGALIQVRILRWSSWASV